MPFDNLAGCVGIASRQIAEGSNQTGEFLQIGMVRPQLAFQQRQAMPQQPAIFVRRNRQAMLEVPYAETTVRFVELEC